MHRTPTLLSLVAAGSAAIVLTSCSVSDAIGDTTRRTDSESVTADGIDRLVITTDSGLVEVRGGDGDEIEIEMFYDEAERGDADSDVTVDGNRLLLTGTCDKHWYERCAVGFSVTVPRSVAVEANTDNGRVELAGLGGTIDVYTDNGRIEANQLDSRDVTVRTDNGRIELGFTGDPDNVDARTDNGRISITVPSGRNAYSVQADSDNGDVDVTVKTDPDADRSIYAYSDNGGVSINART